MNRGWLLAHGLEARVVEGEALMTLLPQRSPLLLVDRIVAVAGPGRLRPAVAAALDIRGDEPVLAGHFPGQAVWPGTYTVEGLAQTCALAGALSSAAAWAASGARAAPPTVMVAAMKVKLTALIRPPARLDYFVEQTSEVGGLYRFAVEASVAERAVAIGTLDVTIPQGAP